MVKIFDKGECVYTLPTTKEIKDFCTKEMDTLWSEVLRFDNPHKFYVDLSKSLWQTKQDLLNAIAETYE
jgi:nicotinate phosphoribosyltransferase